MKKIIMLLAIITCNKLSSSDRPVQKYRIPDHINYSLRKEGYSPYNPINKLAGKTVTKAEIKAAAEEAAKDLGYSFELSLGQRYVDHLTEKTISMSAKL